MMCLLVVVEVDRQKTVNFFFTCCFKSVHRFYSPFILISEIPPRVF